MRKFAIIPLLLLFCLSLADDAYGQRRRKNRYGYKRSKAKKFSKYTGGRVGYSGVGNPKYTTLGFSINNDNYFGDIAPNKSRFSSDYRFLPTGLGVTASKVLYPGIFGRVGFNWANIGTSDYETGPLGETLAESGRYQRNFHFRNRIYELSAGFEIDLIPSNSGARGRFPINPYLFIGVAGFYHSPEAKAPEFDQAGNPTGKSGQWVDLQSLGTEGQNIDSLGLKPYSKIQLSIPLGLGVKIRLPNNFDLNFEVGFRYMFTDYLDDIGGGYADLNAFGDNHLARALSERGAETRDLFSGSERSGVLNNPAVRVAQELQDGDNWESGSAVYNVGANYAPGTNRGNPKNNDFLITTQIRLVYILDKKGMSKGKFR